MVEKHQSVSKQARLFVVEGKFVLILEHNLLIWNNVTEKKY